MTIYVLPASEQSGSISPAYPDCAGDIVQNRYEIDLAKSPLKGMALAVGDIIDVGIIPANATVVDVVLDSDSLDSNGSPTLAYDVGVMSGTPGGTTGRTCGAEFFSGSTLSRAGGVARTALATAFRVAPAKTDVSVGVKITTAAATLPTTGKLGVSVFVKG
jgi:hypothetical protein